MTPKQHADLVDDLKAFAPPMRQSGSRGRAYEMHVFNALKYHEYFQDMFRFNKLTYTVNVMRQLLDGEETGPHALTDAEVSELQILLQNAELIGPTHNHVGRVIEAIAWEQAYDPLIDFMKGLGPRREGAERVDLLNLREKYFPGIKVIDNETGEPVVNKEKEAAINKALRVWFLQLVERWRYPGSPAEFMIIFVGKTGINKSRFGQVMVPHPKWFTSNLPESLKNKDALMLAGETPLIEMGETEQLVANNPGTVWNFLSVISDKYRMPYGKNNIDRLRRCVFFGGSNNREILRSTLGNRRLFPFEVDCINYEALARDRDAILAQALYELEELRASGTEWRVTGKLYDELEEAKKEFMQPSYLDDRIEAFLYKEINKPKGTTVPTHKVTVKINETETKVVDKCYIGDMWFSLNALVDDIVGQDNTATKMKAFKQVAERLRLMGYDQAHRVVKAKGSSADGEVKTRMWHRKEANGQLPSGNVSTSDFYPVSAAEFEVF